MPRGDRRFRSRGSGYDYVSARRAGLGPDETGHWPSRNPATGLILKGRRHPTWGKTVAAEEMAGYEVYYNSKNDRYYSRKKKR